MDTAILIFPHQLFEKHPALVKKGKVFLIEEWLFFNQYYFHKQKLILHRASMKYYESILLNKGFDVTYIEAGDKRSDIRNLIDFLSTKKVKTIAYAEVVDDWLEKRIQQASKKNSIERDVLRTPNFLNNMDGVADYFATKKKYFQTDFYIWQRKSRNLLLEAGGNPIGGKWTFDSDNRERFPKNEKAPKIHFPKVNDFVQEAIAYIEKNWPKNYGLSTQFQYPVTHQDSEKWLKDFLTQRLEKFGIYEDALVATEKILYHSVLTPMLNIGLLSPQQIIDATLDHAASYEIPLNSLEGFIRQILGWREFIRIVYEREGRTQRTKNYWGFTRKIPASFWKGETGIAPIDITINKTLETGYNHHIERLMVLGNFMLLCEFDPNEVHRWFMEMYVDAYDWVMVPNVYGMTQFADGGLMTTKPYISGSNYLMKMGDFAKGDWQPIWDGLFWRFMHVHRSFFLQNPRLGMLVNTFDKMSEEKRKTHLDTAEKYLDSLYLV
jgi:deoxyribodipyrimidine photolyase-related protein